MNPLLNQLLADLPPLFKNTWLYASLWMAILCVPLFAWIFAALLVGPGPSRFGRGAIAMGWVGVTGLGVVVLVRIIEAFYSEMSGGPIGWLESLARPPNGWLPVDGLMLVAIAQAWLVFPATLVFGLNERGKLAPPLRIPMAGKAALVLLGALLLALLFADGALRTPGRDLYLLDLLGTLPLTLVAFAIWTQAERIPPEEKKKADEAPKQERVLVDVPALWRRVGALEAKTRPVAERAGSSGEPMGGWAASFWRDSGALGPPPRALEEIGQAWKGSDQGWLVGDLPDPTERHFLVSATLLALRRDGLRCLVVCDDPKSLRDEVAAALRKSGSWPLGMLVAGEQEMRQSFAGGRMPAALFLDMHDLSSQGIRALASSAGDPAQSYRPCWCRDLSLVVLSRVDRGEPLQVTNRMFTLRRLGLALRSAGTRWGVLATGFGGVGSRMFLEQVFPGFAVREVPFGPRATALVRAWQVTELFRRAPGAAWVKRALEPVVQAGLAASVGDPDGVFGQREAEIWGKQIAFLRAPAFEGGASASVLDEAWLVAAYRQMANRSPLAENQPHDALWSVPVNPVTRFLLTNNNLDGLSKSGQLPPPRPLVGYSNRILAQAHLKTALRESEQDVESLAGIFGKPLVDLVLGEGFKAERYELRRIPGRDGLVRVGLAPTAAPDNSDPLRRTVTDQVIRLIDANGGRELGLVDQMVAATRFYPQRVFAIGDARYEVPLNAYDAKRAELPVRQVPGDRPLTRPKLSFRLESAQIIESPQEVRAGRLAYLTAGLELTVIEQVSGFVQRDTNQEVTYAPVSARYRSRARGIFFPGSAPPNALMHLARTTDSVLVAHLLAGEEDIEVVPVEAGLSAGLPAGMIVVDRHVQGMGVMEALDLSVVGEVLKWVGAILRGCPCPHGCPDCSPREALDMGPDKTGVLRLLGS